MKLTLTAPGEHAACVKTISSNWKISALEHASASEWGTYDSNDALK